MLTTTLASGDVCVLSEEDAYLLRWKWKRHPQGYASRTAYQAGKFVTLLMHRLILGAGDGQEVHHKNGNKLDNRRENLELIENVAHRLLHMDPLLASCKRRQRNPVSKPCLHCGREYQPSRSRRKKGKYCPECVTSQASARSAHGWIARRGPASRRRHPRTVAGAEGGAGA